MATNTVTTEQVHEAIEQFAAMVAAASISPQTVANILEMLRNLNDQEKNTIVAIAEGFIQQIRRIGITEEYIESEEKEIRFETDGGVLVGKISSNGADFKFLKKNGKNVATEDEIPTVPALDSSIGDSPSNEHIPSTKAVKDYVDAHSGERFPITKDIIQSETEEVVYCNDTETQEYMKIGDYGIKAKGYYDMEGNPIGGGSVSVQTISGKNYLVFG